MTAANFFRRGHPGISKQPAEQCLRSGPEKSANLINLKSVENPIPSITKAGDNVAIFIECFV